MISALTGWLKRHSHAILATVVALQNSHAFSSGFQKFLSTVAILLGG